MNDLGINLNSNVFGVAVFGCRARLVNSLVDLAVDKFAEKWSLHMFVRFHELIVEKVSGMNSDEVHYWLGRNYEHAILFCFARLSRDFEKEGSFIFPQPQQKKVA